MSSGAKVIGGLLVTFLAVAVIVAGFIWLSGPSGQGVESFHLTTYPGGTVSRFLGDDASYTVRWNASVPVLLSASVESCGVDNGDYCPPLTVGQGTNGTFSTSNSEGTGTIVFVFSNATGVVYFHVAWVAES